MPTVVAMTDTFNCPNFAGELFQVSPESTPLLSAIGGLTGGLAAGTQIYPWQSADLRPAADNRQRLEGADAPSPETRVRAQASNVLEVHQETVEVSYTKMGAFNHVRPIDATNGAALDQPVKDELSFQLGGALKEMARDIDKSFITGTYQLPTDNNSPRKTRGLIEAITTNVVDGSAGALTADMVLDLMQAVYTSGGIAETETRTIIVGPKQKRALTKAFITDANYRELTRNVGGVNVQTIETDFGVCNVMIDLNVPENTLLVASLDHLAPVFLEVPGKGHLFSEPLAKTGAKEAYQLYCEVGLMYGAEQAHGKLINLG